MASKLFRYIRIFNLPPETEDKEIAAAMSRYGKIHQFVRERYPAEYEYPVYSGIRGVHMELEKEIPASLFIGHFRARIYYDGLKNRCFLCKAEGHLKVDCPKLISVREGETKNVAGSSKTVEQQKPLYSHVAASLKVAVTEQPQPTTSMTTLPLRNVLRRSSPDITTTKNLENTERDPIATNKAAVVQDDTNTKETSTNLDEDDDLATNPIISNTANKEAEEKEPTEVAATHTNAGKNFGKPERYASSTEEDDNPGANENRRERTTQKRRTDSVADSDESLVLASCALAQEKDARFNDGRYYPELYQGKYNDGKYRPDNSGAYRPDGSGRYSGQYVPYKEGNYRVGGQGGSGAGGGAGGGFGGQGGRGGQGSGGSGGSGIGTRTGGSSGAVVGIVSSSSGSGNTKAGASAFVSGSGSGFGSGSGSASSSAFGSGSNSGQKLAVSVIAPPAPAPKKVIKNYDLAGSGFDRIKEQVKQYNNDGYYYRYLTEQNAQVAESGRLEDRETDNEALRAKGFYEYVGDDGVRYRVDYTADENGFVPQGAHLPVAPAIPEQILRALEYVRKLQQ
ncbi:uncharacterized protein LOC129741612 [Uranotaenia lowii]|uniref:uncharacterized protein LOC129741612 n=1 Tax=Uranotaenia lowii TaxID=190385 RepID=UPI002479FD2F|nr:uncharacterized protein LOC129741612 [Uranotaenia lowii]